VHRWRNDVEVLMTGRRRVVRRDLLVCEHLALLKPLFKPSASITTALVAMTSNFWSRALTAPRKGRIGMVPGVRRQYVVYWETNWAATADHVTRGLLAPRRCCICWKPRADRQHRPPLRQHFPAAAGDDWVLSRNMLPMWYAR
jgi:hypothetical protein